MRMTDTPTDAAMTLSRQELARQLVEAEAEISRLAAINKELVHSHNVLLVDGSKWQDRAERLRAILQPFIEADWYAAGTGRFEGRISKEALDAAKGVSRS